MYFTDNNFKFGELVSIDSLMPLFKRYLPIISFIIGVSALSFQTLVLYPWHNDLDEEFKEVKKLKKEQD